MEYSGLLQKYKINRPLSDEERQLQLKQKQRLDVEPHYQLSVIKMNSTFLESVDKYFGWKGVWTALMIIIASMWGAFYLWLGSAMVLDMFGYSGAEPTEGLWPHLLGFTVLSAVVIGSSFWLLRKESFAYTHYPIRLNRKNRLLYVFRLNGTVLTVPWDEVFFTLGRGNRAFGLQNWDIRGHVLDKDGVTVRETFAFSAESDVQDDLWRHWEFLRRYMEDGPKDIGGQVEFCMPIANGKEPFKSGFHRLVVNLHGQAWAQILMLPFFLLSALGRWFAMRTSKIPHWPQDVEDACRIEPGDPYMKDARINPPELW